MSIQSVVTYEDACREIGHWGILPLSNCIPDHPSLASITSERSWHTGLEADPWLWRVRFASEGIAAYGRFLLGKPMLISRELFPLLRNFLSPAETVDERYLAGTLARSTVRIYELIEEHGGIDVRSLRKQAGLQDRADKLEFEHALADLQSTAEIVISDISGRLNEYGNKSGWSSICYTLAQHWMEQHQIEEVSLGSEEAGEAFFAWLEPRWEKDALTYMQKKIVRSSRL